MKKTLFIFFGIIILLLALYYNDTTYGKLVKFAPHQYLVQLIDNTVNEIDFTRKLNQKNIPNNAYVDLILSGDDLKDLQNKMRVAVNNGFIADQDNNWRKAKVLIDGKKQKIKYKLHGTSVWSMRMGLTPWEILKEFFFHKSEEKLHPSIGSGSYSLKIKHKKDTNYRGLMPRYTLINSYDEAELSTIATNKIAANLGLIAPYGKMVSLRINGSVIGLYMLVESHSKEWFERDHQLTSYTVLKSNDDWNRKNENSHESDTDLFIQNKEIKTTSENSAIAVGALEALLQAIKSNNLGQIKRMLDLKYMAKYMALLAITNQNHPITGDNLRYIYNHSTGLSKLLFRIEDTVKLNSQTIAKFNNALFIDEESKLLNNTLKLFKLLLTDTDFLNARDSELYDITKNGSKWNEIAQTIFSENMPVMLASKKSIRSVNYKINRFKKVFNLNIEKARRYLNYNKVFVTKYIDINNKESLSVLNDFNHPLKLREIHRKVNNGVITTEKVNILIKALGLDMGLEPIYKPQKIDINAKDISKLFFVNTVTEKDVPQKHIYINEASQFATITKTQMLQMLDTNEIDYEVDTKNKVINIKLGTYKIKKNIVISHGFSLSIEPGTRLLFDSEVSLLTYGSVSIKGTNDSPIKIERLDPSKSFGSFAIMGDGSNDTVVDIEHLIVDGGSQALINGISFTGQFSIHKANVTINHSLFVNSLSDDGINIKYSKVNIRNSKFMNNFGDQIDLDFCDAVVSHNVFSYEKSNDLISTSTDGLDVSGSIVNVQDNSFRNFSDKGISVGEKSIILIQSNEFQKNHSAVSVKDGSSAFIGQNTFELNLIDIAQYIKKKFYDKPKTYALNDNKLLNIQIDDGSIFYLKEKHLFDLFKESSEAGK